MNPCNTVIIRAKAWRIKEICNFSWKVQGKAEKTTSWQRDRWADRLQTDRDIWGVNKAYKLTCRLAVQHLLQSASWWIFPVFLGLHRHLLPCQWCWGQGPQSLKQKDNATNHTSATMQTFILLFSLPPPPPPPGGMGGSFGSMSNKLNRIYFKNLLPYLSHMPRIRLCKCRA